MPSKSAVEMPLALRNIMLTQATPFISLVNTIHQNSDLGKSTTETIITIGLTHGKLGPFLHIQQRNL